MKPYTWPYPKSWKDLKYRNPKIIKIERGENLDFSSHPEIKNKIDQEWKEAKAKNKKLFNGPLYRLFGFLKENKKLVLSLGLTNYNELNGTNHLFFFDKKFFGYLNKLGGERRRPFKIFFKWSSSWGNNSN